MPRPPPVTSETGCPTMAHSFPWELWHTRHDNANRKDLFSRTDRRAASVAFADQLKKQLLQVGFAVHLSQLGEAPTGQDGTAVHDRDAVAELFGLVHVVGRKQDALARLAECR